MIRVLRDWLSTQPEDDDWDGELRWFNRSREWCGERYRIIVGDARDMRDVADNSVALVVTSPPYFAGKAYEEALGEHRDFIRDLRDNCPHENKQTEAAQYVHECVCEDCGAVLAL